MERHAAGDWGGSEMDWVEGVEQNIENA